MRTRTLLVAGGAALTVTLAASVLVAGQVTASGATAKKLTVTEKAVSIGWEDVGEKGPSIGDTFSFVSDLLNARGAGIGLAVGNGVLVPGTSGGTARYHLAATYRLAGGDVAASGIYDFDRPVNRVAIVGGTGRYLAAQGVLVLVAKSEDTYAVTFRFDS